MTDHNALQWLRYFKNPRGQVAKWLERLNDFDFKVEHCAGHLHGNVDVCPASPGTRVL